MLDQKFFEPERTWFSTKARSLHASKSFLEVQVATPLILRINIYVPELLLICRLDIVISPHFATQNVKLGKMEGLQVMMMNSQQNFGLRKAFHRGRTMTANVPERWCASLEMDLSDI